MVERVNPVLPVSQQCRLLAGVALGSLPEAGRGERRRFCNDGADRPAVSGTAVLRLAPDGGVPRLIISVS